MADSLIFDPIDLLHIDCKAAFICCDENPDFEGRLIDIITDDHIGRAIVEYFSDCPEWRNDLLPYAIKAYRQSKQFEALAQNLVREIFADFLR